MPRIVDVQYVQTHLSRIVDEAAAGDEIIIAKAGKAVARIVPLENVRQAKQFGLLEGRITVPDDFDSELPREVVEEFEKR